MMRLLVIMPMFLFCSFFGLCQNNITGKIVDELGLPIYLASVNVEETEDVTYTDYDGSFSLSSQKDFHWKISIKSKGYKTESFFVLSGGNTGDIILEYDTEMRKLINGHSSLYKKFYRKRPWYDIDWFSKPKNLVASTSFFDGL